MRVSNPIQVLLIEDEAGDAHLVKTALQKAHSDKFSITWADSLQDIQRLKTVSFDVVLLDLSLPDSDGLATIRQTRLMFVGIPIIILTGRCDTEFALTALETGASDYIIKGNFDHDSLARSIRYALCRAEMEAHNNLLIAALEAAANGIVITDKDATIKWVNSAFTRLTGYSIDEAVGINPRELVKSDMQNATFYHDMWTTILQGKHWRGELVNKRKDGSFYHEALSIAPVKNKITGEITHFIGIKDDISERKQLEEQLQKLANTDPLTELYNRRVFLERVTQEIEHLSEFKDKRAALLMMDLDHFKDINDNYGHSTGDEVLKKFAEIVQQMVRDTDIAARLGGEEFAVLLTNAAQYEAMAIAERLRQQVANTKITHKKGLVRITVSIGVTALEANIDADTVLNYADTALYQAKDSGRNQVRWSICCEQSPSSLKVNK